MVQDIYPHRLDNQFSGTCDPADNDAVFCFCNGEFLLGGADGMSLPVRADLDCDTGLRYLFRVDDKPYFLLNTAQRLEIPGFSYMNPRGFVDIVRDTNPLVFAAYTAKHLSDWYRDTRFCGRCGQEMRHSDKERAMVCPACGNTCYPRIMPAVIVGVVNGDSILLTRYKSGFRHFALIAGFTEIGETLEETVAREVMEEAGIRVKNITYYKSQPWGTANDILIGYFCELDGGADIHRDENELGYAGWVKREDVVLQPGRLSLTNEMMMLFKDGKEQLRR